MKRIIRQFKFTVEPSTYRNHKSFHLEVRVNDELCSAWFELRDENDLGLAFDHMARMVRKEVKNIEAQNDIYECEYFDEDEK